MKDKNLNKKHQNAFLQPLRGLNLVVTALKKLQKIKNNITTLL